MLIPILTTLALAELSARDDARQIREGQKIDHAMQWLIRALVLLGACWLCGVPWLSIGLAGLFSAVFRFRLNRLRGFDWRYVSPSNWYDWTFIWFGSLPGRGLYVDALWSNAARKTMEAQWHTVGYHSGWRAHVKWAHRGGTIAYIVEGLVFAVVAYLEWSLN